MSEQKRNNASVSPNEPLLQSGNNTASVAKFELEQPVAKHGLGVITAGLFLAGEMAGSGVLALPAAMIGTGKINLKQVY